MATEADHGPTADPVEVNFLQPGVEIDQADLPEEMRQGHFRCATVLSRSAYRQVFRLPETL